MSVGLDVSGRVIVLDTLQADLQAGGVPVPNGLTIAGPPLASPAFPPPPLGAPPLPCPEGSFLFTYDNEGNPSDLPPEALSIVSSHTPEPTSDPLAELKALQVGTSSGRLRDAIVAYLERKFGNH